jgi:threonine/homoserine/homoserine lactone efflux protein
MEVITIFAGVILAQITPGPNLMAIAAVSLGVGRTAGFMAALGIAVGVFGWAVSFAFGMGAFVTAFPETLVVLRLIGGGYFLYLGLMALRGRFLAPERCHRPRGRRLAMGRRFAGACSW